MMSLYFPVFLCMWYILVRYTFVRKTIRQVDLSARTGNVMSFVVDIIETERLPLLEKLSDR